MTNLQLGLTLSVVGPRAKLLEMTEWPMALRITVGTDSEPDEDKKLEMVKATLPWVLWPSLSKAQVRIAIVPVAGGKAVVEPGHVKKPLEDDADFIDALKEKVIEAGTRLVDQKLLTFRFKPTANEVVDDDEEARTRTKPDPEHEEKRATVPWPGLVATMQSLASPTPAALHCIWYFTVSRTLLAEEKDGQWEPKDIFLSAAPAVVDGANHDDGAVDVTGGQEPYPVYVHKYAGSRIEAHCQALKLVSVLAHEVDEMDNYWLAVRDSGDESLLDLGPRLDAACDPSAPLSVISADELTPGMRTEVRSETGVLLDVRPPTPPEAAAAIKRWKEDLAPAKAAELRARILRAAALAREDQAETARAEFRTIVVELLWRLGPYPSSAAQTQVIFGGDAAFREKLAATAEMRLFPRGKRAAVAPSASDGIDLVIGDPSTRLRHADDNTYKAVDDVAQIQLFGRRSSVPASLDLQAAEKGAPWHALSAARYELADTARSKERVLGMTAAYVDDVLCRELTYVGSNIACEHPLADVHRESLDDDRLAPESFILAAPRNVACTTGELRALPLRYGDYYEFAASVRDRAGGMAKELTGADPWEADLARIPLLDPPQRDRVHYVRRSAVGDCNIGPGAGTSWPQTPAGVALRCLERLKPVPGKPAPSVVFLVPADQTRFELPSVATPPSEYKFRVQAPRASEHVLMRWNMPATTLDAAKREEAVKALKADLVTIFTKRDALMQTIGSEAPKNHRLAPVEVPEILPVDPAVAKVGLRWKFASGAEGTASFGTSVIDISIASAQTSDRHADNAFTVGEGDFLKLTFHALVANEDLARFDPRTLEAHLVSEPEKPLWPGFRAFEGSEVHVETASSELQQPETARLSLAEDAEGHVAVSYDFPSGGGFASVHEVFIESERWVWRNLPIPPEEDHPAGSDRLRRLASGPPLEFMDPLKRDDSPAVARFDKLSEIDDGFVGRNDQVVPYPPTADGVTLLKLDARDEHAHADYLRYSIAFRSRYAPVLRTAMSGWTAKRRIATGFRGDAARIKPPRVLVVLPLTQAMPAPGSADKDATPFLVVLDETWFREYGIGERLAARVARVKPEIPETPADPPEEFRYGPLPDHRLDAPKKDALDGQHELEVFGPFGLSHERGGSQALANATAFVVYPPAGTPPHFNLFAEFARVLDLPTALNSKPPVSEYTEAVALYTLPDMAHIQLGDRGDERLRLRSAGKRYQCAGAGKLLPFPGAAGDVLQQYRYVLVVGHHVRDGGRAVDVFLPADALWIAPTGKDDTIEAMWLGQAARDAKKSGYNAAVVMEILLNGRFPAAATHPLQAVEDLRQLFRLMLHDGPKSTKQGEPTELLQDAPGMIRRVSEWFEVEFGA